MRISDWSSDVCSSDLKGLDSNGALQHYALRLSHLEAGEFWVEIRNDVSSSAIKIDCSEMPRFQRCLAQADELAPFARLTIDQQRGRCMTPFYGVAAHIPTVNGRSALRHTSPSQPEQGR